MSRSVTVGVGCRLGCEADVIEALVRQVLQSIPDATPVGLFTIADKRGEVGLIEAADRLELQLVLLPREALRDQAPLVRTLSPRAASRFGVPSVAEASALAGAGTGATLLVARTIREGATCAIAGTHEDPR